MIYKYTLCYCSMLNWFSIAKLRYLIASQPLGKELISFFRFICRDHMSSSFDGNECDVSFVFSHKSCNLRIYPVRLPLIRNLPTCWFNPLDGAPSGHRQINISRYLQHSVLSAEVLPDELWATLSAPILPVFSLSCIIYRSAHSPRCQSVWDMERLPYVFPIQVIYETFTINAGWCWVSSFLDSH